MELIHGNKWLNEVDLKFENYGNEIRKIDNARFKIVKAYLYFYFQQNINIFTFERKYTIEEIEDILEEESEPKMFNEEIIKNFIQALKEKGVIPEQH